MTTTVVPIRPQPNQIDADTAIRAEGDSSEPVDGLRGRLFVGMVSGAWQIPTTLRGDYFLSSPFHVTPPQDPIRIHPWRGVLRLPKVKVPTASP